MDESKNTPYPGLADPNAISSIETARMALHWALERIRSLESQVREGRGERKEPEELQFLKRSLAQSKADQEMLERRYSQLQKFVSMRPDEMLRAGQMAITEIVEREHQAARLEQTLKLRQAAIAQEEERLTAEAREVARTSALVAKQFLARQQEELEGEYQRRFAALEERQAQQERELADRQRRSDEHCAAQRSRFESESKNLYAELDRERKSLLENAKRMVEQQRGAVEEKWAEEKALLQKELEYWRRKAEEAMPQLLEAKERAADAQEEARLAQQEARSARLESKACAAQAAEWERKASELEGLRRELKAREERCGLLEESMTQERDEYARRRRDLDKLKEGMQAELDAVRRESWKSSAKGTGHERKE